MQQFYDNLLENNVKWVPLNHSQLSSRDFLSMILCTFGYPLNPTILQVVQPSNVPTKPSRSMFYRWQTIFGTWLQQFSESIQRIEKVTFLFIILPQRYLSNASE